MRCSGCQADNRDGAQFCRECGTRLGTHCPNCKARVEPGTRFCDECGTRLAGAAGPSPTPGAAAPAPPAAIAAIPKYLADKILTSRAALEGERKQVTVLFADTKGSTELLAQLDPEDAGALLDPILERMMAAVHRYEGTVNNLMGDGLMAIFGAPVAHEDHAIRACYAALAMQESIREHNEDLRRTRGVQIDIRVGLNSGEVMVRTISNDLHMDYSAVGQTTHLAARMEQTAASGTIRLTASTARLAEGFVEVASLGRTPIKGLADPVEVYELLRALPARSRLQVSAARGLTRFVGRQTEMERLRRALDRARSGQGQVVAAVGEAGIGKSRLLWEFTHSELTDGWLILESTSISYGKATAYLPVVELLRMYLQIEDRDDARKIGEKLMGKLLSLGGVLEPVLTPLLALLDLAPEDPEWADLEPAQRRQRTLDALRHLFLREARVQPVLMVFEDLQWIDPETQTFLDRLVDSLPGARLLLLVNYRPEYEHHWTSKAGYTQIRIRPLAPDTAEQLMEDLLGTAAETAPLRPVLAERSEGNVLFLEESVRALVETGMLVGERGAYRLTGPLAQVQVPATVQAILAARIDRLPAEDKRLLQAASVVGKQVPLALLRTVADLDEDSLRGALARLQAAEFIFETNLFPDVEYTFKHALTHEIAYGSILQARRCALHARLLEAIEALPSDRLEEHVERLAHHALNAEVWDKAFLYLQRSGRKAVARSANREAVGRFEQALSALARLPATRERIADAIDTRFDLRAALVPLGELSRILDRLREAETLAASIGDRPRLGRVASLMANYLWLTGHHDQAIEAGEHALAIALDSEDPGLRVAADFHLGRACHTRGDYPRAIERLRDGVEIASGGRAREYFGLPVLPAVSVRSWLAWCLAERGEFAEASAYATAAIEIAEGSRRPHDLILAYLGAGRLRLIQGRLAETIEILERGIETSETGDLPIYVPGFASLLVVAFGAAGRTADALGLLERGLEPLADRGGGFPLRITLYGEGYLLAGRPGEARAYAEHALGLARQRRELGTEAYAERLIGMIALQHDASAAEAIVALERAASLAGELGLRPLLAQCRVGLGLALGRAGADGAAEQVAAGIALLRELDMGWWWREAERAASAASDEGFPPGEA